MKRKALEQMLAEWPVTQVNVKIAAVSKYDDHQVEIRCKDTGQLIWRAWDFEKDFKEDLGRELMRYAPL
ncbi:DUF905 family protein [Klebsiella pneumoniae]|uniref:DUF905 family protein n=1 Tax=Klebsiella pneumoniae TaxID=573 RepID=UPI00255439CF|nr:DUF905 family protein [Klebsiella pneumoniae]MDK9893961.1 DUF905 domain-containing protein [Klebsiella pneumoniae]